MTLSPLLLLPVLLGVVFAASGTRAAAATRTLYISPAGSDWNDCRTLGAACRTFKRVLSLAAPGAEIRLDDGWYTEETTGLLHVNCHAGAPDGMKTGPITVAAIHARRALITARGQHAIKLMNCSYWKLWGLHAEASDQRGARDGEPLYVYRSPYTMLQHLLLAKSNRYGNNHLLDIVESDHVVVEDNEFYDAFRGAVMIVRSDNATVRRNYIHHRGYADLPDATDNRWPTTPYESINSEGCDEGITVYPASYAIIENNIDEGCATSFTSQCLGQDCRGNKWYGNIALHPKWGGGVWKARDDAHTTAREHIKDFLVVNPTTCGANFRGPREARLENATIFSSARRTSAKGVCTDVEEDGRGRSLGGSAPYSATYEHIVAWNLDVGFSIGALTSGAVAYVNAYNNGSANYAVRPPVTLSHHTTLDPAFGACRVLIPSTSPMKRSGKNGRDKGATLLHQYVDGVLTDRPLWDASRRGSAKYRFSGCGAIVPGVNDIAGASCFDVHKRLHVGAEHGCPLPY